MPRSPFRDLIPLAEGLAERLAQGAVASRVAPATLRRRIGERLDLEAGADAADVLDEVDDLLRRFAVHVTHPRYFGLFNPPVLPETVAAAAVAAAYNPQEAVWSHSPAAVELEQTAGDLLARVDAVAGGPGAGEVAGAVELVGDDAADAVDAAASAAGARRRSRPRTGTCRRLGKRRRRRRAAS